MSNHAIGDYSGRQYVYLENIEHDGDVSLMLACEIEPGNEHGWNGFAVPCATGAEFSRFIAAAARNDRNSTYGACTVIEGDGALIMRDPDAEYEDIWVVCGLDDAGVPVYAIDGWTWHVFNHAVFEAERAACREISK